MWQEYEWETADGSSTVWTEMIRGKDIADMGGSVKESAVVTDAVTRTWQMTPSLHASRSDGLTGAATLPTSSMTASKIYTMGGRSFSVISTKTWETVYS